MQNIAEGSQASGTSKKSELKLTNVARASLEELRLDYEDFLRQRGLPQWGLEHPALLCFKGRRCASVEAVLAWVEEEKEKEKTRTERQKTRTNTDRHGRTRTWGRPGRPCVSVPSSAYVANVALSLPNLCCHLLDRQIGAQATAFTKEGGFTERLYRTRTNQRKKPC